MRLGILGDGQLAKMTAVAAAQLGIETLIWSLETHSPAAQVATHTVIGSLEDPATQVELTQQTDVITLESEFISAPLLMALEAHGGRVLPQPKSVGVVQDKWRQKQALLAHRIPTAPGMALSDLDSLQTAAESLGFPLVIKHRRLSYDGHGTFRVQNFDELKSYVTQFPVSNDLLLAEQWIPFDREISAIVTRAQDGTAVLYPVVETRQPHFVCEEVLAPCPISGTERKAAQAIAKATAEALDLVGTLAVEMFFLNDGRILVNEVAPRPHNSGHFSIEACHTSQFENHVRAVLGLPLGSADLVVPAAVMVNILGSKDEDLTPRALSPALAIPGVHVHWYGKGRARLGRKMGHLTALGDNLADARDRAWQARRALPF